MKALVLKDILVLVKQSKVLLVMLLVYVVLGMSIGNFFFAAALPVMMLSLLTITSFSYDNLAKWDQFALTLPISKKDIVTAKYALAALFMVLGGLMSLLFSIFYNTVHHSNTLPEILAITGGYMLSGLMINGLLLPLVFKLGVEKARMGMVMVFLVPTAFIMILEKAGFTLPVISAGMIKALLIAVPIAIIVLFIISYKVSVSVYLRKEN